MGGWRCIGDFDDLANEERVKCISLLFAAYGNIREVDRKPAKTEEEIIPKGDFSVTQESPSPPSEWSDN